MLRIDRFTHIGRFDRVDVYVHWSVLVIGGMMLFAAIRQPLTTMVGLFSWLGVMFLHECGHMFAAKRRGSAVHAIELYPIFAVTRFETPWSRFDHAIIAWGGVLAQLTVALPIILLVKFVGYTPFDLANEALVLWGVFSLAIAIFNLLPFQPLDGATAWQIVPAAIGRRHNRRTEAASGWRSYP